MTAVPHPAAASCANYAHRYFDSGMVSFDGGGHLNIPGPNYRWFETHGSDLTIHDSRKIGGERYQITCTWQGRNDGTPSLVLATWRKL